MSHTRRQSPLTQRLVADGLKPAPAPVQPDPATLYGALFCAAFESLRTGAPGIAEPIRVSLALSIAMKCERAVQSFGRAA